MNMISCHRRRLAGALLLLPFSNGAWSQACGPATQRQTEGPFFKTNTPQRLTLIEPGSQAPKLVVSGQVLSRDCKPLKGALLDFWHADEKGEYDNQGFRYRGHQLTAALAIHRQGVDCRVRVYEGAREIRPLGVGINLLPHCGRELTDLGLTEALYRVAVEPKEFGWFTHHGQLIHTEPCGLRAGYAYPHFSIHRGDLQMVLYEAVKHRLGDDCVVTGHRCTGVEENGVTLHFDGQASRKADLAIAA